MKLQAKLLLVVIPLIVLPLLTVGWIGYTQLRDTATERTLKEMTTLLDQLSLNIQDRLQTAEANLDLFSRSFILQRYLLTGDEGQRYALLQPTLLNLFRSYQQAYPEYHEIRVLLPDGYEDTRVSRGNIPNLTDDEHDTPYFQALSQSTAEVYSSFFRNPDNDRIALLVAKPLRLRDPSTDPILAQPLLRGYLAITIDLGFMERQVQDSRIGASGSIFFTDDEGTLLFDRDHGAVGQRLPADLFATLRQAAERREVVKVKLDGEPTLLEGRRLHPGLFLFACLPEHELLVASQQLGRLMAGITIIAILITVILIIVFLKHLLVDRIRKLAQAALDIGEGRSPTPIPGDTEDEIGELAHSLQEMAGKLGRSRARIQHMAFYDNLTGLPNRLMFRQQLEHAMAHTLRSNKPLALLFLDIDNFKWVNDTLGHETGDLFLKGVADVLVSAVRNEDKITREFADPIERIVARQGGDEFLILLQDLNAPYDAGHVASRILSFLARPLRVAGHEFHVTGSIGVTLYPGDGEDIDSLIKNADIAMYEAKQRGKNNYQYFSVTLKEAALHRVDMEMRLRRALEHQEFRLHYQPQLDAATGRVLGFEALLRWEDPEKGMVWPDTFIPIAEESGLIIPITAWVLREACRQNREWRDAGLGALSVAVNVSGIDVTRSDVHLVVADALRATGLDPSALMVELTETCVMSAQAKAAQMLAAIKKLGVRVALDDFGTGYSSLNYLRQFSIDELKIDRSFVALLPDEAGNAAIVTTIIAIARNLNLRVTAEGVETEAQLKFLQAAACDFVQGFLFSSAVPAAAVPALLDELQRRSW